MRPLELPTPRSKLEVEHLVSPHRIGFSFLFHCLVKSSILMYLEITDVAELFEGVIKTSHKKYISNPLNCASILPERSR